jgi:hypothetical protein
VPRPFLRSSDQIAPVSWQAIAQIMSTVSGVPASAGTMRAWNWRLNHKISLRSGMAGSCKGCAAR